MSDEFRYTVLLFSQLREVAGEQVIVIPCRDESITCESLVQHAIVERPELAPFSDLIRVASNSEYVERSCSVRPSDEIAFITPVSGG